MNDDGNNIFTGLCAVGLTLLGPVVTIAGLLTLVGVGGPVGLLIGSVIVALVLWRKLP